jgi:predicted CopG family antitoxin
VVHLDHVTQYISNCVYSVFKHRSIDRLDRYFFSLYLWSGFRFADYDQFYAHLFKMMGKIAIVLITLLFKYCLNINNILVKTITIKENVFNRLTSQKRKDESFSDLFERLLDNQVTDIEILRKLRGSIEF